jgi:hypothetical protein
VVPEYPVEKHHQGEAVDGDAGGFPRIALQGRRDQRPDRADAGQDGAGQVGPGVESFSVMDLFLTPSRYECATASGLWRKGSEFAARLFCVCLVPS